jgi:hypothetical protein
LTDPADVLVRTRSRELLQQTLDGLPGVTALVLDDPQEEGVHLVRVLRGLDFMRFAFARQGYGEIIAEMPCTGEEGWKPA